MTEHIVPIAMNGVTGRMGRTQHLQRSILALRSRGGVELQDGSRVVPEPILVGRNPDKLRDLATTHDVEQWTTDVEAVLADPDVPVYFDSQLTRRRADAVRRAIEAGKAIYCEKPLAADGEVGAELARLARQASVKNGIVQDKLFLPGLQKLRRLLDSGFFGRLLSIRGEFGYWVFPGDVEPPQRPSWNYRTEDGGGIILDMFPHWQYVLEGLFGTIRSVLAHGATHIPERVDEAGETYAATADDAAYAIFQLDGGVVAQINSSWTTRVHRDELVVFQVDGTHGSAVAGLRDCRQQHRSATPRPVWDPDVPSPIDFRQGWLDVPADRDDEFDNGFMAQWAAFLRHVVADEPFPWDFAAGARGIQLVDCAVRSWEKRQWIDVPEVEL